MARNIFAGAAAIWLAAAWLAVPEAVSPRVQSAAAGPSSPADARAIVNRYCVTCHNSRLKTAGLALDTLDLERVPADAEIWEKAVRKLRVGAMPPVGAPHPDQGTVDGLASWLESTIDRAATDSPNPGSPALHRLNRAEYANAIRDLLALDVDAASLLPPDDSSGGFDNNADVLGASPALLEHYLSAARKISALAVGDPDHRRRHRDVPGAAATRRKTFTWKACRSAPAAACVAAHVSARRRIRHQGQAARDGAGIDPRPRVLAPGRGAAGRRADPRRDGSAATPISAAPVNATDVVNDVEARLTRAGSGQGRTTDRGGDVRSEDVGRQRRPAAAVPAHDGRYDRPHRAAAHREPDHRRARSTPTGPGDTPSRRRIFVCRPSSAPAEAPCAKHDHFDAGTSRLPPAVTDPRAGTARWPSIRRAAREAGLRRRHRARASRDSGQLRSSSSESRASQRLPRLARPTG